jgi:octaprenyl-diphosphate synthase
MKEDISKTGMTGEELFEEAKKLCEKEGTEGWKLAQETMLKERARSPELQETIEYAMLKYRPDYFRPALLSLCCKAVGGNKETTISTGAALTLFAWAIGIHDDIIDQSRIKNGRPTVLGKFGKDLALILSDVLMFKGFTLMRKTVSKIHNDKVAKILETIERIWFEQSRGEALEVRHRGSIDVTPEECLEKIRMRASEIEACARIGGILGGGTDKQVEKLGKYGRLIGMMAILRDELIDMLELHVLKSRIQKESLPLSVIYALQNPRTKPKLVSLIKESKMTKENLRGISKLSDQSGGIRYVAALINQMSNDADSCARPFRNPGLSMLTNPFSISPKVWKKLLSD